MARVLQSIFYILKYERRDICEKGTNKFYWKRAKSLLDLDFIKKLHEYQILGPKDEVFFGYHTLNFIERNIEGIQ